MKGSLDVPARSTEPLAIARKAPTPPSNLAIVTFSPSSLKMPMSCATYGGRWTTLGGVTGTAIVTFLLVHVAFSPGVGALPEPPDAPPQPTASTSAARAIANLRTIREPPPSPVSARPGGEPILQPLHDRDEQDAHRGHDDHRDQHPVDAKGVLIDDDQRAEALPDRDQELGEHHPDEGARDRQLESREDERQRPRQQHVGPQPALAGVEGARHLEQLRGDVADPLLGVEDHREDREEHDHADLGA